MNNNDFIESVFNSTLSDAVTLLQDVIECDGNTCTLWNRDHTKILGKHTGKSPSEARKKAIAQEVAIRISQQKQQDSIKIEGNKIIVNGQVLPLSEYEKESEEIEITE